MQSTDSVRYLTDYQWHYSQNCCCCCCCVRFYVCPPLCNPIDGSPLGSLSLGFSRREYWSGLPFLLQCMKVKSESEATQSCLTLHDPMDCSLPGFSIHGIFQARILEWVAIPSPMHESEKWKCHFAMQLKLTQYYKSTILQYSLHNEKTKWGLERTNLPRVTQQQVWIFKSHASEIELQT